MAAILIVDDNDDFRFVLRTLLVHHGHLVYEAANGATGVSSAAELGVDLIVLDLAMPVMSGLDALAMLKANPVTASVPVIVLTAYPLDLEMEDLGESFCDAYLLKPIALTDFLAIVVELLSRGSVQKEMHPVMPGVADTSVSPRFFDPTDGPSPLADELARFRSRRPLSIPTSRNPAFGRKRQRDLGVP